MRPFECAAAECKQSAAADGRADRRFDYRVISEGGSRLIRSRVLEKALETERDAWRTGEVERNAIGPENYEFHPAEKGDGELVKIVVRPRRKSRMLVDGAILVRNGDADLVQVEGQLATNPSVWTRRVEVVREYERVAGVRVPIALESTAHVRIAGRSTFRMTYQYLHVNGENVPAPASARSADGHDRGSAVCSTKTNL